MPCWPTLLCRSVHVTPKHAQSFWAEPVSQTRLPCRCGFASWLCPGEGEGASAETNRANKHGNPSSAVPPQSTLSGPQIGLSPCGGLLGRAIWAPGEGWLCFSHNDGFPRPLTLWGTFSPNIWDAEARNKPPPQPSGAAKAPFVPVPGAAERRSSSSSSSSSSEQASEEAVNSAVSYQGKHALLLLLLLWQLPSIQRGFLPAQANIFSW